MTESSIASDPASERIRILLVAGARPNFMKIAPIMKELGRRSDRFEPILVHTGQHYDEAMSESFFKDLGIPSRTSTWAWDPVRTRSRRPKCSSRSKPC